MNSFDECTTTTATGTGYKCVSMEAPTVLANSAPPRPTALKAFDSNSSHLGLCFIPTLTIQARGPTMTKLVAQSKV
eukprot:scaffold168662_cov27-Tisochrysis_lutea.AAC.1